MDYPPIQNPIQQVLLHPKICPPIFLVGNMSHADMFYVLDDPSLYVIGLSMFHYTIYRVKIDTRINCST